MNMGNKDVGLFEAPAVGNVFALAIKRLADIVGAVSLLISLSPLFLLLAIIIKREGGNVFFRSRRLGKFGREFNCLKFRTMVPDAEGALHELLRSDEAIKEAYSTHRKIRNDPRVTKIGKFLRENSIDELPQLVNVIKGEMSIVGPRPILLDEAAIYGAEQLAVYYSVRPGITGLWQVSGRNKLDFRQRVALDMQYIKSWSLWNDMVIFCRTLIVLLKKDGAY
jgi:lipopolysaccharide/colanic/teichoic acid biosynthesis glycosyltransferase